MVLSKEQDVDRKRSERGEKREIGPLPTVFDAKRRELAKVSLQVFCETYLKRVFKLGWSRAHLRAIERFEKTIQEGGLYSLAMPRASGKTALARAAVLWAILYGYRKYIVFVSATDRDAKRSIKAIKTQIQSNQRLLEDFPEACYPVLRLERMHQRASGQLLGGKPTDLVWKGESIQLANIEGSACSGSIIEVAGITGTIRGRNTSTASGEEIRPDYFVVDDFQTKKTAKNPVICAERIETLQSDVLGCAGPDVTIAGCLLATVIEADDAADQLLDRKIYPEWFGERTAMLESMPVNLDMWRENERLYRDDLITGASTATEHYIQNRAVMDDGAIASWEDRKLKGDISAVQSAMNLLFKRGERTFWAEYQNQPRRQTLVDTALKIDQIIAKVNGVPRQTIPSECDKLTAFIDVQQNVLYYVVAAWDSSAFGGSVIDYGTFPEQNGVFFSNQDIKRTLFLELGVETQEAAIYQGLEKLYAKLMSPIVRNGIEASIDQILIDANWGESTEAVYRFARAKSNSSLMPSHGRYIGENGTPFNSLFRKPGETIGHNWKIPIPNGTRISRHVSWDTNFWKSFVAARLKMSLGSKGGLTLFGANSEYHRMFADHCTSEESKRKTGNRTIDVWNLKVGRTENHWWDCVVGCAVAASMVGCRILEAQEEPRSKKRMTLSQLAERGRK